jgi:predicted metal-dependent hydrolase
LIAGFADSRLGQEMRLHFRFFPERKPADGPSRIEVASGGELCAIEIRRHAAARRYTLRVRDTSRDVVLTMPLRGSMKQARNFAEKNAGWIAARLKRLPGPVPFADGATVPLRGVPHRIAHRPEARGTVWIEHGADGPLLCVAGKAEHVARRLRDFLKCEAKRDLVAASRKYAEAIGVSIRSIAIRDTASRWGSCSCEGALSFSWRLVLAPPFVLDYLAAHEVAHLVEMNHGPRFWRLVKELCPHMDRAKAWMRAEGATLHAFGPAAGGRPAPDPDAA